MGTVTVAAGSRVYLDANAFIYVLEKPSTFPEVVKLFRRFGRGELSAVTSVLTLAEVLVVPMRQGNTRLEADYRRRIAPAPTLNVMDVDRDVVVQAASIRATISSLKLPDAIHVASALLSRCDVFVTNDGRIGSVAGLRIVLIRDLA